MGMLQKSVDRAILVSNMPADYVVTNAKKTLKFAT